MSSTQEEDLGTFDLTAAGYANRLFSEAVLTHGNGESFSWDSLDGTSIRSITELDRVYFEPEEMWMSRWQLNQELIASQVESSIVLDSPNPELVDTSGRPVDKRLINVFIRSMFELRAVTDVLNSNTEFILSRCIETEDTVHKVRSPSYKGPYSFRQI